MRTHTTQAKGDTMKTDTNQANNMPLYHIEKNGAMYEVKSLSGKVQFRSMKRANCKDWLKEIARQEAEETTA